MWHGKAVWKAVWPKMGQERGKMDTRKGQEGAREAQVGPKMVKVTPRWGRNEGKMARKAQERHKLAPRAAGKRGAQKFRIFGQI